MKAGHVTSCQPITAHLDSQHAQLGVLVAEDEEDNEGDDGDGEDLHILPALHSLTGPYIALMGLTWPYLALLGLT